MNVALLSELQFDWEVHVCGGIGAQAVENLRCWHYTPVSSCPRRALMRGGE